MPGYEEGTVHLADVLCCIFSRQLHAAAVVCAGLRVPPVLIRRGFPDCRTTHVCAATSAHTRTTSSSTGCTPPGDHRHRDGRVPHQVECRSSPNMHGRKSQGWQAIYIAAIFHIAIFQHEHSGTSGHARRLLQRWSTGTGVQRPASDSVSSDARRRKKPALWCAGTARSCATMAWAAAGASASSRTRCRSSACRAANRS